MTSAAARARCLICEAPGRACGHDSTTPEVVPLDPLNPPAQEVDPMPDLKLYDVIARGQKYGTRLKLNAAGVKVHRELGATVTEVVDTGAKGAAKAPANKAGAPAGDKAAGSPPAGA